MAKRDTSAGRPARTGAARTGAARTARAGTARTAGTVAAPTAETVAVLGAGGTMGFAIFVLYALRILHLAPWEIGLVFGAGSVGAIIGEARPRGAGDEIPGEFFLARPRIHAELGYVLVSTSILCDGGLDAPGQDARRLDTALHHVKFLTQ